MCTGRGGDGEDDGGDDDEDDDGGEDDGNDDASARRVSGLAWLSKVSVLLIVLRHHHLEKKIQVTSDVKKHQTKAYVSQAVVCEGTCSR